jgi:hypothetical protein
LHLHAFGITKSQYGPLFVSPETPLRLIVDAQGLAHFLFSRHELDFWHGFSFSAFERVVVQFVKNFRCFSIGF